MGSETGTLYLGRQPIVDNHNTLIGYELLYRNESGTSEMKNEQSATAKVLTHTLSLSGIEKIVGDYLAFINIDTKFLEHDMILSVPKERFVFEIDPSIELTPKCLKRLDELKSKHYSFALCIDDVEDKTIEYIKKILEYIEYIKLNTMQVNKDQLLKLFLTLGLTQKKLIATHVETKALYESFNEMGFKFFQGYFFAKPEIVESTQVSSNTTSILRICNLLTTDAPIKGITEAFSNAPSLVIQLLQYLNSCTFHFKGSITSIEHIITLLGRKPLVQWLFLSLYASQDTECEDSAALLIMIQQRTQLIVDLLKAVKPDVDRDEVSQAYFVGLLSLMNVIIKQPIEVLLDSMQIDDVIVEALMNKGGLLGEIYEVSLAIEQFDLAKTEMFMLTYDISPEHFQKFLFRSFEKANNFSLRY